MRRLIVLVMLLLEAAAARAQFGGPGTGGQRMPIVQRDGVNQGEAYRLNFFGLANVVCSQGTCTITQRNPIKVADDGGGSGAQAAAILESYGPTADFPSVIALRRAHGTIASPSPAQLGDKLGTFAFQSYDGVNFDNSGVFAVASLETYAAENHDATHHASSLKLFTHPFGSTPGVQPVYYASPAGASAVNALLVGSATTDPDARLQVYEIIAGSPALHMSSETGVAGPNDNPDTKWYMQRATTTGTTPTGLIILGSASGQSYIVTARVHARCQGSGCTAGQALGCETTATITNTGTSPGTAALVGTNTYAHCNSNLNGVASGPGPGGAGADTCQEACKIDAGANCGSGSLMCVIVTGLGTNSVAWYLDRLEVSSGQ